MKNCKV